MCKVLRFTESHFLFMDYFSFDFYSIFPETSSINDSTLQAITYN